MRWEPVREARSESVQLGWRLVGGCGAVGFEEVDLVVELEVDVDMFLWAGVWLGGVGILVGKLFGVEEINRVVEVEM